MSTRKYLSGYEKLLKKRKIEKQIESQKGSMDKFVTNFKKKNTTEILGENITNEQGTYQKELEDNEIIQQKENNENSPNNIQTSYVTIIDNEKQNNLEENEKMTKQKAHLKFSPKAPKVVGLALPLLFDNMLICPRLALFVSLSFHMLSL